MAPTTVSQPSPLAWLVICDHSGNPSCKVHVGRSLGDVRPVNAEWSAEDRGMPRGQDGAYLRTGVVVLRLPDIAAGKLLAGHLRVRRGVLPGPADLTVRTWAMEPMGIEAIEPTPAALRPKASVVRPQIVGLYARASAGLELKRRMPAA